MNNFKETEQQTIIAVVAIAIITFMGILSETALNIAYSRLMDQFNISAATIQWLTTGYLLTLSAFIPLSPILVKCYRTKKLFRTAVIIFLTGTLLCGFALNFGMLLLGRIIQAVGTSITLPLMVNIILEKIPVSRRGKIMGIVGLVTCFAPALGPTFGGVVIEWINWHWIFILMLPVLMLAFGLGSKYIMDIHTTDQIVIDYPSIILSTIGLVGIVYGVSISADFGWLDPKVLGCLAIGLLSLGGFIYKQLQLPNPLIEVRVFTYPMFTLGMVIVMISMMTVLAAGFILPLYLQKSLGCSSLVTALAMLPGAAINGVMSPVTGKFLDKHGPKLLLSVGFLLVSLMVYMFAFFNCNFYDVIIIYAVFMFGASMLAIPAQSNGLNQLPKEYNADGSAIVNTLQQVSGAVGTALASSIFTISYTNFQQSFSSVTLEVMHQAGSFGVHNTFVFFLFLSLVGFGLALKARR
ncbi:MAG: drug resistance transporter, EmrB/QacA subfamily [Firmicutes bacterium]|nr:drug resistance transporter, EmrB/QacA subfamily [Bacillota bacterium]